MTNIFRVLLDTEAKFNPGKSLTNLIEFICMKIDKNRLQYQCKCKNFYLFSYIAILQNTKTVRNGILLP